MTVPTLHQIMAQHKRITREIQALEAERQRLDGILHGHPDYVISPPWPKEKHRHNAMPNNCPFAGNEDCPTNCDICMDLG